MKDLTEPQFKVFLIVLMIILGLVGKMDFEDQVREAKLYKERVCYENMPNYKGIEIDCY